jgi:hypothetical protein
MDKKLPKSSLKDPEQVEVVKGLVGEFTSIFVICLQVLFG